MDTGLQAIELIRSCEAGIRALIEDALAARAYDQVPRLATYAAAVSAIVEGTPSLPVEHKASAPDSAQLLEVLGHPPGDEPVLAVGIPKRTKSASTAYPMFVREPDRLVKLGWSKKDREVYEHRAPLPVVQAVFEGLLRVKKTRGVFKPEDLLHTKLADGVEVPSYQVYLVLAWLRSLETVQRQGNDGYKILQKPLASADFSSIWEKTQERAAR